MQTYQDFFISELGNGFHSIEIERKDGNKYPALVEIKGKKVKVLQMPTEYDMYSSWTIVKGDQQHSDGKVMVWAYKNQEIMQLFTAPTKVISFVNWK